MLLTLLVTIPENKKSRNLLNLSTPIPTNKQSSSKSVERLP